MYAKGSVRLRSISVPPTDQPLTLGELPVSDMLRETLRRIGIQETTQLANLPLAQLMDFPTMGARRVLELFAVIDSLRDSDNFSSAPKAQVAQLLISKPAGPDLVRLEEILAMLGTTDIESRDIRFGTLIENLRTHQATLKGAIGKLRAGVFTHAALDPWPTLRTHIDELYQRLVATSKFSLGEDLLEVLTSLTSTRKARIVAMRLGWLDGVERTLQQVGETVGLTRERVRQMEARAQQKLSNRTAHVPALLSALRIARRLTPCSAGVLSNALIESQLTRESWGPDVLIRAATYLGVPHGLVVLEVDGKPFLAGDSLTGDIFARARRLSWEYSRTDGAAYLPRVAFALSEELERRVSFAEIRSIVGAVGEVRWIDEHEGWYWLGDDGHTTIFNTVRKLLAVARRLPIDDLYEGLLKSYRMDVALVAPKPILLKMLAQVSWLRIRQMSHVEAVPALQWQVVLTGAERVMVQVLKEAGGVLDHFDFKRRCRESGVPPSTFGVYSGNSGIFVRVNYGIWGLRGVEVDALRLLELTNKVAERKLRQAIEASERAIGALPESQLREITSTSLGHDPTHLVLYRVTASAFRNYCVTFARLRDLPVGTRLELSLDSAKLGRVAITTDRRLRGFLPLLKGAGVRPGRNFVAEVNLAERRISLRSVETFDEHSRQSACQD